MSRRIEVLDSLRGVAALTVVIYHLLLMLVAFDSLSPHNIIERLLISTPLSILWSGHESVVLFFVLSGFVLSLPFYGTQKIRYRSFITRRICRIYIPYLSAILLALLARSIVSPKLIPALSGYFNRQWTTPLTWQNLVDHLIMVGPQFNTDTLDSPMWSLIHEMRISLIFPLLMYAVIRFKWTTNVLLGVLLSMIGIAFQLHYHATYQPVYKTLPYILMFIIGAIIAKHRRQLVNRLQSVGIWGRTCLLCLGLLLYDTTDWILKGHLIELKAFCDIETLAGASIIISLALSWERLSMLLLFKPIKFLGKISYSLYLFHVIVLYVLTYLLYGLAPIWLMWVTELSMSILVAAGAYYIIELPAICLGRFLTRNRRDEPGIQAPKSSESATAK